MIYAPLLIQILDNGKIGKHSLKTRLTYLLHVYYKDQFEKKFKKTFEYPIILNLAGDEISIILDKNEIAKIDNLPDLLKEVLIKTGHQTP